MLSVALIRRSPGPATLADSSAQLDACRSRVAVLVGSVTRRGTVTVMEGTPPEQGPGSRSPHRGEEVATEAERARTPRTPGLALAGVWIVVAVVVAIVVALTFIVYFALG